MARTGNVERPAQRQAVAGIVERAARGRQAKEGWRPRCADRSAVVGNRIVAGPGAATRPEAPLQARCGDCHAASARGGNGRGGGEGDRNKAEEAALREWCAENGIELSET